VRLLQEAAVERGERLLLQEAVVTRGCCTDRGLPVVADCCSMVDHGKGLLQASCCAVADRSMTALCLHSFQYNSLIWAPILLHLALVDFVWIP
jgi:hypothetical protein